MDKMFGNTNQLMFFIILLPFLVILFLGILYMLKVPGKIRDRNREAERLCKTVNANKILTNEERGAFRSFVMKGVVSKTTNGNYALSERAIRELLEVT